MTRRLVTLTLGTAVLSIVAVVLSAGGRGSAQSGGSGTITGRVIVATGGRGAALGEVVVYVEGTTPRIPASAQKRAEVRQRDLRFEPELVVVPRGSVISFPNEDRVFHNVFSLSRAKRFDLGLYRSGDSRDVTFDRAGRVDVYCNIHPDMVAQILVLDSAHYALATSTGEFLIPNVPAGTWNLVAMPRFGEAVSAQVAVRSGGVATQTLEVRPGRRATSHRRKDGTPYGRYR